MASHEVEEVKINFDDVPQYLRQGALFDEIASDPGAFSVPKNFLKADLTLETVDDFRHLLESLRYWACSDDSSQEAVVAFLLKHMDSMDVLASLIQEFKTVFPYLHLVKVVFTIEIIYEESSKCPLSLVQYVLRKHPLSLEILLHLIRHETIQKCISHHQENDDEVKHFFGLYSVNNVASEGNLDLLQLLFEQEIRTTSLCYHSAQNGHLACLEYLVSKESHLKRKTSFIAAANGHVDVLIFLHEKKLPFDDYCCRVAAANGKLEALRYLHSIDRPWGKYVPAHAARHGHLDCLQFAHENGCEWDASTCCDAAESGHLDCLTYAHQNGCPWEARTTFAAVKHLPCLHYAVGNGCPYSSKLAEQAFRSGHDECGWYLLDNCDLISNTIYLYAAQSGRLDIMMCCHTREIPWHQKTCSKAAHAGHRECLGYAQANGAPAEGDVALCTNSITTTLQALLLERDSFFA